MLFVQSSRMAHHPRHHYRLAAGLAEAGHDVTTLAQPDVGSDHRDAVPVEYLPVRGNRLSRMASGPITMWRAARRRPDALHVVSLDLLPWAVVLRLLRRGDRPVVLYDSNDEHHTFMLIKEWIPKRLRPILGRLAGRLEPWLAARLDAATTALPATQERFERAGVRSLLVRNFPPSELAENGARPAQHRYDVLIGGSLPEDQIPLLAETARLVRERTGRPVRWLLAARNYGQAERTMLERALSGARIRDDFDLRFNVPFPEMRRLMDDSRVGFVLYPAGANYAARIPIRIFEYMAAGIPFVASDLPTTARFTAGRGVALLAAPGDVEAYADSLTRLLADDALWAQMAERGPELVREEYNWGRECRRLVALYEELVGSPSQR